MYYKIPVSCFEHSSQGFCGIIVQKVCLTCSTIRLLSIAMAYERYARNFCKQLKHIIVFYISKWYNQSNKDKSKAINLGLSLLNIREIYCLCPAFLVVCLMDHLAYFCRIPKLLLSFC